MTDIKKMLGDATEALRTVAEEVVRVEREALDRTKAKANALKGLEARLSKLEEEVGGDRRRISGLRIRIEVTYADGEVKEITT